MTDIVTQRPAWMGLAAELRGFSEGSTSARATLMRDAAALIEDLSERLRLADEWIEAPWEDGSPYDSDIAKLIAAVEGRDTPSD